MCGAIPCNNLWGNITSPLRRIEGTELPELAFSSFAIDSLIVPANG